MITYNEARGVFELSTPNTTTLLGVGRSLQSLYWGGTVNPGDVAPAVESHHSSFDPDTGREREEYPVYDGRIFTEPCLLAGPEGQSALFFELQGHTIDKDRLAITLREAQRGLTLTLEYEVFEEFDIIGRRATLKNEGAPLPVRRFFSGCCTLPAMQGATLRYLTGKWMGECRIQDVPVAPGVTVLQSKRGIPGPHFNPSFALHANATEQAGEVWFGLLAYSGNWKICVEKIGFGNTHVLAGRNDFDGAELLETGESLATPTLYSGYTSHGFGGMSRLLHAFERERFTTHTRARPVLYNSWEATTFDVSAKSQMELARRAAAMGVELFVMDDGWFGQRHSDRAGLGDWTVNPDKFPNGLDELIDYVKSLGMEFGIWVEPEAVNPDSELYRAHPEWIYRIPGREPMTARNQYVLDLSLPAVKAYVKDCLYRLLSEHDIRFLKWDMNRPVADVYSESGGNGRRRRGHVESLYEIWAWLKQEFPGVALESCSGGGGRVDLGILQWADTFWPSDNTDPYERLFIQEGFTQFYAPATMTCWVTDTPDKAGRPGRCGIAYKFHAAMCGPLGIGADIGRLDDEALEEYKKHIAAYKEIRQTVQFGTLHRLSPPQSGLAAVQYTSPGQTVVLAFLHSQVFGDRLPPLRLRGLEAGHTYRLSDGRGMAGSTLMNLGVDLPLAGDFSSCLLVFTDEGPIR